MNWLCLLVENVMFFLDDGTEVWLNADSKLKYPITFSGESREVILSGRGLF